MSSEALAQETTLRSPPIQPTAGPARAPRRSRHTNTLSARGEPMVWLTGGALCVALVMIVSLLVLILVRGGSTFWPVPIVQVKTYDKVLMGEVDTDDYYAPSEQVYAALSPEIATKAKALVAENGGLSYRRSLRTGNYELTQNDFNWVEDFTIVDESQPEWAVVMERQSWGRFYGTPTEFLIRTPVSGNDELSKFEPESGKTIDAVLADGTTKPIDQLKPDDKATAVTETWKGAEPTWQQYLAHHDQVRRLWRQQKSLEKHDIGAVNRAMKRAELNVVQADLDYGAKSPQHSAAVANLKEVEHHAAEETARINAEIDQLRNEYGRFRIKMVTADGQSTEIALADIVRAYPANQLTYLDKVRVYLSRWGEFLADVPREANSEGGVFPAIWGTLAMTLIMSAFVAPFGVLAALYLREYAKGGAIVSAVRIAINNLAGVPSIVFGVFGLGFFCYGVGGFIDGGPTEHATWGQWFLSLLGLMVASVAAVGLTIFGRRIWRTQTSPGMRAFGSLSLIAAVAAGLATIFLVHAVVTTVPFFDGLFRANLVQSNDPTFGKGGLLWASLTLALLTLPVVIVATEEALAAVPNSMREGSYACGASKWQTIRRIVLPRALPGIMTGMILAMARGAGEVAPLMLVGVVKYVPELPVDGVFPYVHPDRSFMHLGFQIYDVALQSRNSQAAIPTVFTTTLLLVGLIAILNIAAVFLRARLRKRFVSAQF